MEDRVRITACPQCGAPWESNASLCIQCDWSLRPDDETSDTPPEPPVDLPVPWTFGLDSLMMVTALAAVCISVSLVIRDSVSPVIGVWDILFAWLSVAALIRTIWCGRTRARRGKPLGSRDKVPLFLRSFVFVAAVGLASFTSFVATCAPTGAVGFGLSDVSPVFGILMYVAWGPGIAVGLYVGYRVFLKLNQWNDNP